MDVKAVKPMDGVAAIKPSTEVDTKIKKENPSVKETQGNSPDVRHITAEELQNLSLQMNKFMKELNAGIQFTVHEKTHSLMVQVVDVAEQKVLKEFPPREFLDTIANIREYVGFLLDKKA